MRNKLVVEKQSMLSISDRTDFNVYFNAKDEVSKGLDELFAQASKASLKNDFNITQIAYETGFADTACFTKAFKSQTGSTPSSFRKNQSKIKPDITT